jgi:Fur family transcriptional regulator, iron response regulator
MQIETILREKGIQPSAQRVAVASYVLHTHEHPSAELVFRRVKEHFPWISRATVYNTLNLFVEKGLLQRLTIAEDSVVFDAVTGMHHHFIDEDTGAIYDVPWERVQVCNIESLQDYDVKQYEVVLRGKLKTPKGEM